MIFLLQIIIATTLLALTTWTLCAIALVGIGYLVLGWCAAGPTAARVSGSQGHDARICYLFFQVCSSGGSHGSGPGKRSDYLSSSLLSRSSFAACLASIFRNRWSRLAQESRVQCGSANADGNSDDSSGNEGHEKDRETRQSGIAIA